nr:hypothetical protein BaRGS_006027 [Batillaria attramentaria]
MIGQSQIHSTMKPISLAFATLCLSLAVAQIHSPADAPTDPSIDEIMQLFNAIKDSDYFQGLSFDDQMLVLELASGGQAGKMNPILDNIGHERFLSFVYNIPFRYFDNLMQFTLGMPKVTGKGRGRGKKDGERERQEKEEQDRQDQEREERETLRREAAEEAARESLRMERQDSTNEERLVDFFMQHDCFYNKSAASYTNRVLKRKLVDGIAKELKCS